MTQRREFRTNIDDIFDLSDEGMWRVEAGVLIGTIAAVAPGRLIAAQLLRMKPPRTNFRGG